MNRPTLHKSLLAVLVGVLFFMVSCEKKPEQTIPVQPLISYSYWIYDSVEGDNSTEHFAISRLVEILYDPGVDKCYMANNIQNTQIDTFDRSPHWRRGYINRNDFLHRIIFNGDTITIHHNVQNQIGETKFRYTLGVKQ